MVLREIWTTHLTNSIFFDVIFSFLNGYFGPLIAHYPDTKTLGPEISELRYQSRIFVALP